MIRAAWHRVRGHQVVHAPTGYDGLTWRWWFACTTCGSDWLTPR